MQRQLFTSLLRKPLVLVLAAAPLLALAQAGSLSGPSNLKRAQTAQFSGNGFTPNAAVSIAVVQPGGVESHYSTVVLTDGTLTYGLAPSATGSHQLKVLDSGGQVLASTMFLVSE